MNRLQRLVQSSVGAKITIAITGLLLFAFVIVHLLGNLQLYRGRDAMNSYAETLHHLGPLLWLARLILLGLFVSHLALGFRLYRANRAARGQDDYYVKRSAHRDDLRRQKAKAAAMMLASGAVILLFVLYHLMHFTLGWIQPSAHHLTETLPDGSTRHDVYGMVIAGFQNPLHTGVYVVAMLLLGWHLFHGATSILQTLGLTHPVWRPATEKLLWFLVAFVVVGNCFIPLSILLGFGPQGG